MTKFYIAFGILTLIVIGVIAYGFYAVGSPWQKQKEKLDQTRINDLTNLRYDIENFYSSKNRLPNNLEELDTTNYKDPETGSSYSYIVETEDKYKLCANFSTDSSESKQGSKNPFLMKDSKHKKGYDCISYEIPASYKNNYNTSPFTPAPIFELPPTP